MDEKARMEAVEAKAKEAPIIEIAFDAFCKDFRSVKEVMATPEWDEIYSYYYEFDEYEQEIVFETDDEIENYSPERQMEEYVRCANSFAYFCHKFIRIAHPIRGLIPFRLFKYQRRVIHEYERHRFTILSKFRQGGLSTVSVLWALWLGMFRVDQRVLIVSKTDREAIAAGEIAQLGLDYLPGWLLPKMSKSNEHERRFEDTGSVLWCYTVEAARSKSITVLIIDEAAFISDMEKHWKGLFPVLSTGGKCCVVSTVNGVGNWYEDTYHKAQAKKNKFKIIDLDYYEHPEYNNPKWIEETRANLGEKGWKQEVMRSFLGSGETFLPTNVIEDLIFLTKENHPARTAFEKWENQNQGDGGPDSGALWLWREPVAGREYILAADCAEGVGEQGDNSSFQIIDVSSLEQVTEFYSYSVPPHIFAQIIHQIGMYYNHALVVIENMSQGGTVLSALKNDLFYDNLYYDPSGRMDTPGLKTGKNNRPAYMEALQNKVMNKTVRINSRRLVNEFQTFIFNPQSKKPEATRGKHDDAILAMSMALYVRDVQMRDVPLMGKKEELPQVFKSEIYQEIKREILAGSADEWLDGDPDMILRINEEGDSFPMTALLRKRDHILREFGW